MARDKFDAGALKESSFKKLVKKGADLKALATFPIPTKPWIARAGLDSRVSEAISASLLEIKDPVVLKALKKDGFLKGSDEEYAIIRSAIENNAAFFE